MAESVPGKVKAAHETLVKRLKPFFGNQTCMLTIPSEQGSPEKLDVLVFDWLALAPKTREAFETMYEIGKNAADATQWFIPFAIVPRDDLIDWYEAGEPTADEDDEDNDEGEENEENGEDDEDDDEDDEDDEDINPDWEDFDSLEKDVADRLIMTVLMNQPDHFVLYEAYSGHVHVAEMTTGVKYTDSLDKVKIKSKRKLRRK